MIKTLQKKFIFTAMAAVTALLLVLLGAINITNIIMVRAESIRHLDMIAQAEGNLDRLQPPPAASSQPDFSMAPREERDIFLSSNFFTVRLNDAHQILAVDVEHIASVDEDSARKLALQAVNSQRESARLGRYRYRITSSALSGETIILFLDTSNEILSYLRVLLLSAGMGILCWFLMLFLIIFLSRKAILPIAQNIRKQEQFITDAGHELKTPLAIILANTEAMELYNGENKWSRNIKDQTQRLSKLVQNMLFLARMDESSQKIMKTEFSLSELLSSQLTAFSEPFELQSLQVQSQIQPDLLINASKEQISQLISILLDNAAKYTSRQGQIFITLKQKEKNIVLRVKNSCSCSENRNPERWFDRFYRDDQVRNQKAGGYGIGLSAAQSIVQAHQGSIQAEIQNSSWVVLTISLPAYRRPHQK